MILFTLFLFILKGIFVTVAYHKNECYEFVGCPDKLEAVRGGMQFLDWKGNSVSQLHISQPEFNENDSKWKMFNDHQQRWGNKHNNWISCSAMRMSPVISYFLTQFHSILHVFHGRP